MKRRFTLSVSALVSLAVAGCGGGSTLPVSPQQTNTVPTITSVTPTSASAGGAALTIDVKGSGFVAASTLQWNATALSTTYISATELSASLPASDLATGTTAEVTVVNTGSGGGTSPAAPFVVNNPQPVLASINPVNAPAGAGALSLDMIGSGFVPSSVVTWNNVPLATTFVSGTEVKAALPAANDAIGVIAAVAVSNPTPAGGNSGAINFNVNNPVPAITAITPPSVNTGAAATALAVAGSGFLPSSVVSWNGNPIATTFVNSTQVMAAVPTQDIAAGQVAQLSMANPAPGGGHSPTVAFNVTSPIPHVASISPATIAQGSAATITLSGTGFEANSGVTWNGSSRPTTFISATSLQVALTAGDAQTLGAGQLAVTNPGPGGTTAPPIPLTIVAVTTPIISSITPASTLVNATGTTPLPITIQGSNFAANAALNVNGQALAIAGQTATSITTGIPAPYLAQAEQLDFVVTNPGTVPAQSTPYVFNVVAVPVIGGLTPASAPIASPEQTLQVTGSGFLPDSVVNWNGVPLATQYVEASPGPTLTATLPAAYLSMPTVGSVTVSSPENAAAVSQPQAFPTYLALPTNTIVYNQQDGMLYASIPGYVGAGLGNTVAVINPSTGVIEKTIPVGSEPDKLSLSDTGTELYVSLDGAAAVKQIDLTGTHPNLQISLGEYGTGQTYSYAITAASVAALPGEPDSVAVLGSNANITVYDSGVARPNPAALDGYFNQNFGSISFGPSAATLYASTFSDGPSGLVDLTLGSTGFTGTKTFSSPYYSFSSLQFDAGNLYFSDGAVLNATTGSQIGQFYTSGTNLAAGPVFSDSTLGRAWVLPQNALTPGDSNQILAFDETTFKQVGAIVVAGTSTSGPSFGALDLVRWGQNGLAFNTPTQIYMLRSPLVKDLSQSPADLSVAIQAPSTSATGSTLTYSITVTNNGPNAAQGVTLTATLAAAIVYQTTAASAGSCTATSEVICSLGSLASGARATVQVTGTVLDPGSIESTALVSSAAYDPVQANNIATATTTVSGATFAAVPTAVSASPTLILAGSSATTLTVTGTGFTTASTIFWNGNPLPTSYLSDTQLSALVPSSYLAKLGWGQVVVSTPSPGGGQSYPLVVNVYQSVNVPAADILYDPFSRMLYATVPAVATNIAANSLVQIDPMSGTVGTPVVLGNGPNVMAETADGRYLYIGFSGNNTLGQFNLLNQTMTGTYPLTMPGQGSQPAGALAVQPGSDTTLAINLDYGGMGIFDISGNTGTFRPHFGGARSSIAFADSTHLYSEASNTADVYLGRFTVDANGLTQVDFTGLNGLGGTGFDIALGQDGLVYGDNGGIVNPATTPPSQIALLPISPGAPGYDLSGDAVVPDSAQHKVFLVGLNEAGAISAYLERFDTISDTNEQNFQLPLSNGVVGYQLLRWGQDGLAVRAFDPDFGTLAGYQLLLFKGPFVLPAEAQSNPIPGLTGVAPSTVVHGSGNQYLTATGSGFIPGAVVLWNGVPRTTTYVDASHLQFAVAAADVAASQTVSLTAENPGSGASPSLTLPIN